MSIGKRITEVFEKLNKKDYEAALIPLSIAVAATSTKEYPRIKYDNQKYKTFLTKNIDIITLTGIGVILKKSMSFKLVAPSIKYPLIDGMATLEEILYHIVRCNLIHEAELDKKIIFQKGNTCALLEDAILLPSELLEGMIFAVIGSSHNSTERLENKLTISIAEESINLDTLWGEKSKIMDLLEKTGPKKQI